uniref:Poly [ADP-ribose] polymerase n=1 Tax=Parastrongyloides trichosuri TaxID=131310 RepID=A0A0N4ZE09_PARTI
MKKPKLIDNEEELKKEIELLDALWDIEATVNTMNIDKPKAEKLDKHPMDDFYEKMKCELKHLEEDNEMRKTIVNVLKDTKCPTHTWYNYNVKDVFEVERDSEEDKFLKDIPNRKLLWHGSRVTNWYGIL